MPLLLGALAVAGCHDVRNGTLATFSFVAKPCAPALAEAGARCGTVAVPENHSLPDGRRIGLNVIVFAALEPAAQKGAQFDLEGGPGFAVTESAEFYAGDGAAYRRFRDVVLVDMRGTGASNPLRCAAIETNAKVDPAAPLYPPDLVATCAAALSTNADLRQYTTAAAARDLDAVRAALGYDTIDLNALSYGTTLALRYIADYPQHVRTAVMTGTVSADRTPPRHHAAAGARGLQLLLDACRHDAACAERFPHLSADLDQVAARLDRQARDLFFERLRTQLYLPATARRVPLLIHSAALSDPKPSGAATRPFADGLYLSITCSESMARMDVEQAIAEARTTVFGAYRLQRQRDACAHWPAPASDPRLFDQPQSDVPVLFISGAFDPVTPPEWTAHVAAKFPRSTQIVVPQGGHVLEGMSGMDTCLDAIILQFVADRSAAAIDRSCVASMSAGPFVLQ